MRSNCLDGCLVIQIGFLVWAVEECMVWNPSGVCWDQSFTIYINEIPDIIGSA